MGTLIVGGFVILIAIIVITHYLFFRPQTEYFVNTDTLKAQRQMLQWEGEHRYNDLARLQTPGSHLDPVQVTAAVSQTVPVPTGFTDLLSTLRGVVGLGSEIESQGSPTEQTGSVQDKVKFCESLPVDCGLFGSSQDPRMAECGFCHRDGTDSMGKPHRGGMYISSDDQIRANELAKATGPGTKALYQPTVGRCAPENFTVQATNCKVREAQLKCQQAGGPTLTNECGQCYGGGPGSAGLLYVGPKPRTFSAILWVSHPGSHSNNGHGMTVQVQSAANGSKPPIQVPYSNRQLLDPQQIPITGLTEGDTLTITVVGAPAIWCGWISSPDGKRTVSLDIGQQSISPADGFVIAGDKRSGPVVNAVKSTDNDVWTTWSATVPSTVLWYQRRETVPGAVASAWYGSSVPQSQNAHGVDVTDIIKSVVGTNAALTVQNSAFNGDPAPGLPKHLWLQQDNGGTVVLSEDDAFPTATLQNSFQLVSQVPATLVAPIFSDDLANCSTGPMVFTPAGAGLMGSHSCFKADGSFNPTPYCLQELWTGAGGTPKGTGYPATAAAAAALVVNNSIDDTVAALNNQGSIALYGVDMTGKAADFLTVKAASLFMLGISLQNPCDGPQSATGPHTPECLDYLWRTATQPPGSGPLTVDPSTLPYAGCNANGLAAPLNPDGTPNVDNVSIANGYGSVAAVRAFFARFFTSAQDSSNFDAQVAAMRDCYNVNLTPPPPPPDACPRSNPDEWQPVQTSEVFLVNPTGYYSVKQSDAAATCASYGAQVATPAQIQAAQQQGASWCAFGWASDGSTYYPMSSTVSGCGSIGVNPGGGGNAQGNAAVNCYGVKPPPGAPEVVPWANPNNSGINTTWSLRGVQVAREVGDRVQCAAASGSGNNCAAFDTVEAAQAWIQQQPTNSIKGLTADTEFPTPGSGSGSLIKLNGANAQGTNPIYWVPAGTTRAHLIPECNTGCTPNVNVCTTPGLQATLTPAEFANTYTVAGNYQCGMGSDLDTYLRQRV